MTNDKARMTIRERIGEGRTLLFIFALILFCGGCIGPHNSTPHIAKPHLVGKIVGNSYTSQKGHFSVPFPVSPEVGGRVLHDHPESVTFYDNWGSKIEFSSHAFNPESPMMTVMENQGRSKALETLCKDIYGNQITTHYHPDVRDGTLSFIYLKPVGPKTGVAAFVHDNRVYMVETDLLPGVQLLDDASDDSRNAWLENRAIELLQTMEIK
jgi:hypothetical protein